MALTGCMMPEQVEELMYAQNHQKMVLVISSESKNGDVQQREAQCGRQRLSNRVN